MTPLRTLLFADNRPGHYMLAEGILAAIGRRRPVAVTRINVRRPVWMPARALSFVTNSGMPPQKILQSVYRLNPDLPPSDLILSAGGNTLGANVAAAKLTGAANIFYGSLRRYRAQDFSLVMSSYPGPAGDPRHLMTLKPSAMDPDKMPVPDSEPSDLHGLPNPVGLIIGGNSGTITYEPSDWDQLFEFMDAINRSHNTRFIVSNSPRTPDSVSDCIKGLAQRKQSPIAFFLDFRKTGPGSLPELLANVSAVLVTADSSTMLSESIWARRKTIALTPLRHALPDAEETYRRWLCEKGWTRQLEISRLSGTVLSGAINQVTPLDGNPLERLADEIQNSLPDLFR